MYGICIVNEYFDHLSFKAFRYKLSDRLLAQSNVDTLFFGKGREDILLFEMLTTHLHIHSLNRGRLRSLWPNTWKSPEPKCFEEGEHIQISTDSRDIQLKNSLFFTDSQELFRNLQFFFLWGGLECVVVFSLPKWIFLHPLLVVFFQRCLQSILQPVESLQVALRLYGVYLTSRMEGLDSMMATMILSM